VEQLIKDLGRFARLEIHPHVLRHTAATNMIETGADLVTVEKKHSRPVGRRKRPWQSALGWRG